MTAVIYQIFINFIILYNNHLLEIRMSNLDI